MKKDPAAAKKIAEDWDLQFPKREHPKKEAKGGRPRGVEANRVSTPTPQATQGQLQPAPAAPKAPPAPAATPTHVSS